MDSVIVNELDPDALIFAPNAFTPDGDNINDTWQIQGFGEQGVELSIFNRWGEKLWETDNLSTPWDGTYDGELVKQDVYVYVLRYQAECAPNDVTTSTGACNGGEVV